MEISKGKCCHSEYKTDSTWLISSSNTESELIEIFLISNEIDKLFQEYEIVFLFQCPFIEIFNFEKNHFSEVDRMQ